MAQKTIPQLTEATSIDENAIFPFDTGTETKKITGANLAASLAGLTPSSKFISKWISTVTYAQGDMVYSGKDVFVSLKGTNLNKAVSNPVYWEKVFSGGLNPQVNEKTAIRAVGEWTGVDISVGAGNGFTGMAWSPELKLYAATVQTNLGTYDKAIWTSPDGKNWTQRTTPECRLFAIEWCPEWKKYVAVGHDASANPMIIFSADGETWDDFDDPGFTNATELADIAFSKAQGKAVVVGVASDVDSNDAPLVFGDGSTWTPVKVSDLPGNLRILSRVHYVDFLNTWFVSGTNSDGDLKLIKSADGETWVAATNDYFVDCVSDDLLLGGNSSVSAVSRDGETWDEITFPAEGGHTEFIRELGLYVATADNSTSIYYSLDGRSWVEVEDAAPAVRFPTKPCFAPQLGIAVFAALIASTSGSYDVAYSRYVQKII